MIRRIPERHASIAFAVRVAALEALSTVTEHQRAGRHQRSTER
jgi:hypothetical protein